MSILIQLRKQEMAIEFVLAIKSLRKIKFEKFIFRTMILFKRINQCICHSIYIHEHNM